MVILFDKSVQSLNSLVNNEICLGCFISANNNEFVEKQFSGFYLGYSCRSVIIHIENSIRIEYVPRNIILTHNEELISID